MLSYLHTFNYSAVLKFYSHFSCILYCRPVNEQEDVMGETELVDGEQVNEAEDSDGDSNN